MMRWLREPITITNPRYAWLLMAVGGALMMLSQVLDWFV